MSEEVEYKFYCSPGPCDDGVRNVVHKCANGCGRMMCTASEQNFADFCCRRCAETGVHSESCNAAWAWMQQWLRADLQAGNRCTVMSDDNGASARFHAYQCEVLAALDSNLYKLRVLLFDGKPCAGVMVACLDGWRLRPVQETPAVVEVVS